MKLLATDSWFYRLGILALLGAAMTINFVIEFAAGSPAPRLIASASVTAILLSIPFVLKKKRVVSVVLVLAVAASAYTFLQLQEIARPSAAPMPPIPFYLSVSFILTIAFAALAVLLWVCAWVFGGGLYNPQITPVQNGITLVGVLASAISFNLPTPWGVWIGWAIIAVTLISLEPIWKSEAAATARLSSLKLKISELEAELKELRDSEKTDPPRLRDFWKTFGWKAKRTKS